MDSWYSSPLLMNLVSLPAIMLVVLSPITSDDHETVDLDVDMEGLVVFVSPRDLDLDFKDGRSGTEDCVGMGSVSRSHEVSGMKDAGSLKSRRFALRSLLPSICPPLLPSSRSLRC